MVTLDVHTEQREAWLGGDLGGDVLERVRRLEADARATSSKLDALLAHLKVPAPQSN
jgi:hypothetical protein